MITSEQIARALENAPSLRPLFEKCARRAMRGNTQPASMTVDGIGYDEEHELSKAFCAIVRRSASGRVAIQIPDELRAPKAWSEVALQLGIAPKMVSDTSTVFKRAELMYNGSPFATEAANIPEIVRFIKDPNNAKTWLTLFGCVSTRWPVVQNTTTISQLGSDIFGDSKSLRNGQLKRQLFLLLQLFDNTGIDDERTLFKKFGIIDNPFTTHVTVFAPFEYTLADGTTFDYPNSLFAKGMACQLPLETIERIANVNWKQSDRIITTSENAAPFSLMVTERKPCVYTEGYPNSAVKGLLKMFASNWVEAIHEGDADLDGFNIAEDISRYISVRRTVAEEVLLRCEENASSTANATMATGIQMSDVQKKRLRAFLEKRIESTYSESYSRLERLGRWFEQESFHEA